MKRLRITLGLLILFTVTTGLVSGYLHGTTAAYIILVLAAVKFNLVAFEFMELRRAHHFWKALVIVYSVVFISIYAIILSS
jgi:heme/copper-type cytochrome/quinol oxidase subunit 4